MTFPKFNNLKISTRLWLWVGIIVSLLIVMMLVSYTSVNHMEVAFEEVEEESSEMYMVMDVSLALSQVIMPVNDYLIPGGDPNERANFNRLTNEVEEKLNEIEPHAMNRPDEKEIFLTTQNYYQSLKQKSLQIFAVHQEEAYRSVESGQLMEEIDILVDKAIMEMNKWQEIADEEIAEVTQEFVYAQGQVVFVNTILILFIILFSLILGIIFIRSITKPLAKLVATSQEISAGNLNARAEIVSKDEIGILAQNFNKMTDSLIETRKLPENIIRSMADSLIVVTPEAKIKEVNRATLDLLGYARKELFGQQIEQVFGRAAAAAAESIFKGAGLKKLIEQGTIKDERMMYLTKKGEEIPVAVSGSVTRDEKGKLQYIVVVAKDLREIKKYAEERLAKITPVLQKVAMGDFSENVEIPEKEDEFTGHLVALNLTIDDLRETVGKNVELVKALEKEKTGLEQKVKERTRDIDAANQQLKASNQQLNAANQQLSASQKQLQDKLLELERFNKVAVGRELRMVELKEEIARLKGAAAEQRGN